LLFLTGHAKCGKNASENTYRMDSPLTFSIYILVISTLLFLSAFFSGSETAFFSLNPLEKEKLKRKYGAHLGAFISRILVYPEEVLVTILTGNMFVNLFFASLMDTVVGRFIPENAGFYSIMLGTSLVLIFGELAPKNLAIRHSLPFFSLSARPLYMIHLLLTPFRRIVQVIEKRFVSFLTGRISQEDDDTKILITLTLQAGLKKGIIHHSELTIIESFLDFREKTAMDVMIPRTELRGMDLDNGIGSLTGDEKGLQELFSGGELELVPVFRGDMDHMEGYLNIGDILPYRFGLVREEQLSQIIKPVHPVPERKKLLELLGEMIETGREMSLVVDEYGGTAGIVTFQQLIEDFLEFFYPTNGNRYTEVSPGVYRLPGLFSLEELEELFNITFDSESRTLAGLIIERIEEIPVKGREIILSGLTFTIQRVSRNRILEVEVRRKE